VPPDATGAPERDGSVGWAWVLLAAAVLFLASAAWFAYQRTGQTPADPGATVDRGAPTAPSTPAWPSCAEVFVPGRTIDEEAALAPCRGPDGRLKAVGNFVCQDGRHLFQVDANTGAPGGWGFGGSAYRETADAATDRDYAAAYRECTS
jgi:hypothetical protein